MHSKPNEALAPDTQTRSAEIRLIQRYYSDPAYRASMPCGECGKVGGCEHFPTEDSDDG